jgi:hypothetical protein
VTARKVVAWLQGRGILKDPQEAAQAVATFCSTYLQAQASGPAAGEGRWGRRRCAAWLLRHASRRLHKPWLQLVLSADRLPARCPGTSDARCTTRRRQHTPMQDSIWMADTQLLFPEFAEHLAVLAVGSGRTLHDMLLHRPVEA